MKPNNNNDKISTGSWDSSQAYKNSISDHEVSSSVWYAQQMFTVIGELWEMIPIPMINLEVIFGIFNNW
jgi:hypothetical protein